MTTASILMLTAANTAVLSSHAPYETTIEAEQLGLVLIGLALYLVYAGMWVYLSVEKDWPIGYSLFMIFVLPLIVAGLLLIF